MASSAGFDGMICSRLVSQFLWGSEFVFIIGFSVEVIIGASQLSFFSLDFFKASFFSGGAIYIMSSARVYSSSARVYTILETLY